MKRKITLNMATILLTLSSYAQWIPQNSGTSNFLPQIFFLNKDTGFVVQDNGILRRTLDGGTNWNIIYSGATRPYDVAFSSFLNGNAIGDHMLLKTIDGGFSWTPQYTNLNMLFSKIFFPSANTGYATALNMITDSTLILKSSDGGTSWNIIHGEYAFFAYYSLGFMNPDTGFVIMESQPYVFKTFNGGMSWQRDSMNTAFDGLEGVFCSQSNEVYVVGTGGIIFKSSNYGNTWSDISDPGNSLPLYSASFTSSNNGFVAGGDGFSSGIILRTSNGGMSWANTPGLIQTFTSIVFPIATIGYACGTNGTILKYDAALDIDDYGNSLFSLNLFPNPATTAVTINFGNSAHRLNDGLTVQLCNTLGECVKDLPLNPLKGTLATIDVSDLTPGIYFITITDEQGNRVVRKMVKM